MKIMFTSTPYGEGTVRSFASILDSVTVDQAKMLSRHPLVHTPVALMPDAHLGRGATVGSVIMTNGGLIPSAVGVDIGCGIIGIRTSLTAEGITYDDRIKLSAYLREHMPSGVGKGGVLSDLYRAWLHRNGETAGVDRWNLGDRAASQFGSLGGGNHFAEFAEEVVPPPEVIETEADLAPPGHVWILVHSGSRGVGNKLATEHIRIAQRLAKEKRRPLEDIDLAYFTIQDPEFHDYWVDMQWAQNYAFAQREAMAGIMSDALARTVGEFEVLQVINCHHNYSVREFGNNILTRKGAIDASEGTFGIIPGSMGAATYVVLGKGNPASYNSSAHGAGRLMSRGVAKRTLDLEKFKQQMQERGVVWQDRSADKLLDEAPGAYKPIDVVMHDSLPLVETVHELRQFVNFKGAD